MKKSLPILLLICLSHFAKAQYEMVLLNYEKAYFNENKPLPAGKFFILTSTLKASTQFMEVGIYPAASDHKVTQPIFQTNWKRSFNEASPTFTMPVNHRLRENEAYDVEFRFYRAASPEEKAALYGDVCRALDGYIDMSAQQEGRRIRFKNSNKKMVQQMNAIMNKGTELYRNHITFTFEGFSDMVAAKMVQLEELKLQGAPLFAKRDLNEKVDQARLVAAEKAVAELKNMVHGEVNNFLNTDIFVMQDKFNVDKYPTERAKTALGLNAGYAAVFPEAMTGNVGNNVAAPYAALSFALGKETAPAFLRKTSLSVGALFNSALKDKSDNQYTGAFIGVPTFAALGFRPYKFVKLNLGAAFLEKINTAADGSISKQFMPAPMISLGIEFNISVEMAK